VPHCGLAQGLDSDGVAEAFRLLHGYRPITATVTSAGSPTPPRGRRLADRLNNESLSQSGDIAASKWVRTRATRAMPPICQG
jgi:hypothetical protein